MSKYKVVILAAGVGNRLENLTKDFNKALLPVGFKPVISHIIEKFPKGIEFVVAIGHRGELLKEFLQISYPEYAFSFVGVDNYKKPGSGPGYSLLKCKEFLQCPFIISTVDTIVLESIPKPSENWLGVSRVEDTSRFNSVKIKNGYVVNMLDKVKSNNTHAFIGLCGINDYKLFWDSLSNDKILVNNELQLSNGLKAIVESQKKMKAKEFSWFDTGDIENYTKTKQYFNKNIEDFDFSKTDEFIYFIGDRVIKYFKNVDLNKKRIKRSEILSGFVPSIDKSSEHFLSYKKIEGHTLYRSLNNQNTKKLLEWLQTKFWKKIKLNKEKEEEFYKACHNFYYTKTLERVRKYFKSTNTKDEFSIINNNKVPKVYTLLKKIDWKNLEKGTPTTFHGDLQFDNILLTENKTKPFILLDWRPEFAGLVEYGDFYYDLAKLYGGLILPYYLIKEGRFEFTKVRNNIELDVTTTDKINSSKAIFEEFIIKNGFDFKKVKLLTTLIFLNMSPLHNEPFNYLLHYLGKLELMRLLDS